MDLFVAGCHGGETRTHRTCAFVIDGRVALDAGALTSALTLREQCALDAVVVGHCHLDHVRDLGGLVENRLQCGAKPLRIYATNSTLKALGRHYFNGQLWPDFRAIPSKQVPSVVLEPLRPGIRAAVGHVHVTPIAVSHTVDSHAFLVEGPRGTLVYSGDTGPTERLWTALNARPAVDLLLLEVSFPNREQQLAQISGHHTPASAFADLQKYTELRATNVAFYHIKPAFEARVEHELARLRGLHGHVARLGETYRLGGI